jgi:anti-sigma regulatory factor (Ser/Thr protein kinase)
MDNPAGTLKLTLSPRLSELTRIRNELDQYLGGGSLPDIVHNSLLVVAEEVLTNIVLYGCCDEESDKIEIQVDREDEAVHMEFIDPGKPFNPLGDTDRKTAVQLVDDQMAGGIGIHLVRGLTNYQGYARKSDRNHFRVRKNIHPVEIEN